MEVIWKNNPFIIKGLVRNLLQLVGQAAGVVGDCPELFRRGLDQFAANHAGENPDDPGNALISHPARKRLEVGITAERQADHGDDAFAEVDQGAGLMTEWEGLAEGREGINRLLRQAVDFRRQRCPLACVC